VTKGRTSLKEGWFPAACLSVSFAYGDVEGTVLFDIPEKTAFEIAAMNSAPFHSIEPMVLDTLAELMNMIVGRA
jgi:CheY-specific phosphatase CheX